MHGAGYQAVYLSQLQHHGAQYHCVVQLLLRQPWRQSFTLAQVHHRVDIAPIDLGGVDDLNVGRDAHAAPARQPVHAPGIAHQYAAGDATLVASDRRLDGARLVAFGQDDALVGLTGAFHQDMLKRRGAEPPLLNPGQQRFFPLQGDMRDHSFHCLLHPIPVVERDFQIEVGQIQHRLHSAVGNGQDGQAGVECRTAQLPDAWIRLEAAGDQHASR